MRYINNDSIFQFFQTMGYVTQDAKRPIFQNSTLFTGEMTWLRSKREFSDLYSCNIEEAQYYLRL